MKLSKNGTQHENNGLIERLGYVTKSIQTENADAWPM